MTQRYNLFFCLPYLCCLFSLYNIFDEKKRVTEGKVLTLGNTLFSV